MKHLEVVAAILEYKGKILCMERGKGKYDYVSFKYAFMCHLDKPDFIRKEHVDAKWLPLEDLLTVEWAPADIPIVERLAGK